jgi:GNAT superfamily N-acetyltransferase
MEIREAMPDDNEALMALQSRCPQGKRLIISVVNTPDFFARAKAYESFKVYVALDKGSIVGSAAFAIRDAVVNGKINRVGYGFQAFVAPEYRRFGVISLLQEACEQYAFLENAILYYTLIIEDNTPSIRWHEHTGLKRYRTLVVPALAVYKEMELKFSGTVRPARTEDLPAVAELLNETWQDYELYGPTSAEKLLQFIRRTPAYDIDNLLVLQEGEEILACLGYWEISKIMRVSVKVLSFKIRIIGILLRTLGKFRQVPNSIRPGDMLKQILLTPIGFKKPGHLPALLRYVNNLVLPMGIEQIFLICERGHEMLKMTRGFIRAGTTYHLYVKSLQKSELKAGKPVFIDGIDL